MSLRLVAVHLTALWTLAFVQPLFAVLGDEPAFFVARGNTAGDILILAFGWTLVPPLLATALVALAGRPAHLGFVALFAAALSMQLFQGLPAPAAFGAAAATGIAAALLYARAEPARAFVTILGVAPVVVLALLLLVSDVRRLVLPGDAPATAAGAAVERPAPVVLLVFDELPTTTLMDADRTIDGGRYPNFARLARASTWYRNATSVADGTYVAVPAIFTGVRPEAELPTSHEYPRNLFALLGGAYEQHVFEPLTSVCPATVCGERERGSAYERLRGLAADLGVVERRLLLPDELADDLPAIDRDFEDFGEHKLSGDDLPARRVRAGRRIVRTMTPGGGRPGLWMVHYVVPHIPWRFLPDGSQYPVLGPEQPGLDDQTWGDDPFLLDQAEQRHVLNARFADRLLGEAMDRMQSSGLWEDALVIVVADHGVAIGPGDSRRPVDADNFAEIAGVPLFVKRPGQAQAAISERFVTTLDVLATIVDELRVDTDWELDGVPVGRPREVERLEVRNGREARLVGATPGEFLRLRDTAMTERLDALWRVGPRPDLLGRPLSSLTPVPGGGQSGFLNNAALYAEVDPASGIVPAYVTGAWEGLAEGTDLAVAVNGRIEATGEAYLEHGDPRFSMLVPPRALRPGANRVEVVAVEGESVRSLVSTG